MSPGQGWACQEITCWFAVLQIDSIYYFVVGDISEEAKQLLVQRTLEIPCPVCTMSFNARGEGTVTFLKDLSAKARGR